MSKTSDEQIEVALAGLRARKRERRDAAVATLCEMFEPLVRAQAERYQQSAMGAEPEDLQQEARVGLLEACRTFDAKKGYGKFAPHATWCIRHTLAEYVAGLQNPVRLPSDLVRRLPKLRRVAMKLAGELQRVPTPAELSAAMGMPIVAITQMLFYDDGPVRLDEERRGHKMARPEAKIERFRSPTASPEEALMEKEDAKALRRQTGE